MKNSAISFQGAASPIMEGIIDLHHHIFFFLIIVLCIVVVGLFGTVYGFSEKRIFFFLNNSKEKSDSNNLNYKDIFLLKKLTHNSTIELVWMILPTIVLILIGIPSFVLLYSMDEIIEPALTLKITGHQWYWSYVHSKRELSQSVYDSYMIPESELVDGQLRLLDTNNPVFLPIKTHIRLIITAADVLHSWAIPALGIKIDAVPGRLNQGSIFIKHPGVFYGQCSEICGVQHGFMPISLKAYRI